MRTWRWQLCLPWFAGIARAADEGTKRLKEFGLAESTSTPALGRVIVVFVLLAALAWAAAWLLRRYGARLRIGAVNNSPPIRALARSNLPGGIACHLVEVQGTRVLITASRHGVTSLQLEEAPATPLAPVEPVP
jgi:hypothetical protein